MRTQNTPADNHKAVHNKFDLQAAWSEDPMNIIVMLVDKSLLHISRARASLTGWGNEGYQTNILRAVDVIKQLQLTLNMNSQHVMAENLNDLYAYVIRVLVVSIQHKSLSTLNEAAHLLMQIRESLSVFVKKPSKVSQH